MKKKRATQPSAKLARRDSILDAADSLFETLGFDAVSMALVADRAGLAKGTPYRYFVSKEAVFLALFEREFDRWLIDLELAMTAVPAASISGVAAAMTETLAKQARLVQLLSILHAVLERNLDLASLQAFKRRQLAAQKYHGLLLESKLPFLQPGDGGRLFQRSLALAIGIAHQAYPAPQLRKLLAEPEFERLRVDFAEELENQLFLLIEGQRSHYAGHP